MKEREWKQTSKRETQSVPRAESCDAHIAAPGTIILSKWQRQIQIHKDKCTKTIKNTNEKDSLCQGQKSVMHSPMWRHKIILPKWQKHQQHLQNKICKALYITSIESMLRRKNVIFQVCERTPYPTCTCLTLWPSPPHYLFYTCKGSQEHFGKLLTSVKTYLAPTSSTPSISTSFS